MAGAPEPHQRGGGAERTSRYWAPSDAHARKEPLVRPPGPIAARVTFVPLVDLGVERVGFGPQSVYLEYCLLPLIGPSCCQLFRRVAPWSAPSGPGQRWPTPRRTSAAVTRRSVAYRRLRQLSPRRRAVRPSATNFGSSGGLAVADGGLVLDLVGRDPGTAGAVDGAAVDFRAFTDWRTPSHGGLRSLPNRGRRCPHGLTLRQGV